MDLRLKEFLKVLIEHGQQGQLIDELNMVADISFPMEDGESYPIRVVVRDFGIYYEFFTFINYGENFKVHQAFYDIICELNSRFYANRYDITLTSSPIGVMIDYKLDTENFNDLFSMNPNGIREDAEHLYKEITKFTELPIAFYATAEERMNNVRTAKNNNESNYSAPSAVEYKNSKHNKSPLLAIVIIIFLIIVGAGFLLDEVYNNNNNYNENSYENLVEYQMPDNEYKFINIWGEPIKNRPSNLIIENPTNYAYLVWLCNNSDEIVFAFFVRPQSTATMHVGIGTYYLEYAKGFKWYGNEDLFGPDTIFYSDTALKEYNKGETWRFKMN